VIEKDLKIVRDLFNRAKEIFPRPGKDQGRHRRMEDKYYDLEDLPTVSALPNKGYTCTL